MPFPTDLKKLLEDPYISGEVAREVADTAPSLDISKAIYAFQDSRAKSWRAIVELDVFWLSSEDWEFPIRVYGADYPKMLEALSLCRVFLGKLLTSEIRSWLTLVLSSAVARRKNSSFQVHVGIER